MKTDRDNAKKGWSLTKAQYRPVVPRFRLFKRLMRDTWANRKHHGGAIYVLVLNFQLATWLKPTQEKQDD